MKVIINPDYGGASLNQKAADRYNDGDRHGFDRENEELIEAIENGEDVNGSSADLYVVELPEGATDYYIFEYDGAETLVYALDGKIYPADTEDW